MNTRSRSTLFLMEQLIVILVFAICSASCVKIFAESYMMAEASRDLSRAVLVAESGAECFKAMDGDMDEVSGVLGGVNSELGGKPTVVVYYNAEWKVCGQVNAAYMMRMASDGGMPMSVCDVSIEKVDGDAIFTLTASARGGI